MLHQNEGVSKAQPTRSGAPDGTAAKKREMKLIDMREGCTVLQGVSYPVRKSGAEWASTQKRKQIEKEHSKEGPIINEKEM